MSKVKVRNDNNFNVGIRFEDGTHRELVFRSGVVLPMEKTDVMNIDATSKLFKRGILTIEEDDEVIEEIGIEKDNPNAITIEEIEKILKMGSNQIRTALKDVTAKHAIDKVIKVATDPETNLPASKTKVLNDMYGINLFEDMGEEIV